MRRTKSNKQNWVKKAKLACLSFSCPFHYFLLLLSRPRPSLLTTHSPALLHSLSFFGCLLLVGGATLQNHTQSQARPSDTLLSLHRQRHFPFSLSLNNSPTPKTLIASGFEQRLRRRARGRVVGAIPPNGGSGGGVAGADALDSRRQDAEGAEADEHEAGLGDAVCTWAVWSVVVVVCESGVC